MAVRKRNGLKWAFCLVLLVSLFSKVLGDGDPITCGSVIKLIHRETTNHLHSHQVSLEKLWGFLGLVVDLQL